MQDFEFQNKKSCLEISHSYSISVNEYELVITNFTSKEREWRKLRNQFPYKVRW